ncbi:MAG TPA: tetratricopeptide repeat protein [Acetobacteraceae bacterium]|nr:tetratricopeptide repeat protein [Acetobacteraceae bacterium]
MAAPSAAALSETSAPGASGGARRLVAILHADMVGYSRLVQLDELGTLSRLRAVREELVAPLIGTGGGRVVNTAGDSVLVTFNSVTAAVRCAVDLQRALAEGETGPPDRRIRFRVGVELGDVLAAAADGPDIGGHGVNLAARLQAACPPGRVCVSRAVRDQLRDRAEFGFEPFGTLSLKNIAGPVEAFLLRADDARAPWGASARAALHMLRRRRWPLAIGAPTALLLAASLFWQADLVRPTAPPPAAPLAAPVAALPSSPPPPPSPESIVAPAPRLSLVVLHFAAIGDDRNRAHHLADAVTEDLTTDLSAIDGALVIARGSAAAYRGRAVDLRQIGRELGVRYAVQGSVRRHAEGVRVNVQLVSAETGAELWADRFDQDIADLALGQADIVRRIARALGARLVAAEGNRSLRERPTDPDAFDLMLRARSLLAEGWDQERVQNARALYEQALRLAPDSATAMIGLANVLLTEVLNLLEYRPGNVRRAAELLAAAERLVPDHRGLPMLSALVLRAQNRLADAVAAYEQVIATNPNSVLAYQQAALCKLLLGQPEDAVPMLREAIRRDPRDRVIWIRYSLMGQALLKMRLPQDAIPWLRRAIDENAARAERSSLPPRQHLASALGHAGRIADARRELAEVVRLQPLLTVRGFESRAGDSPVVSQNRYVAEGLRAAGLRDHAPEDADSGLPSDGTLSIVAQGPTPTTVPGAATIRTDDLVRLIAEQRPIILDLAPTGRALPGAVLLRGPLLGGDFDDALQDRLRRRMLALTRGDFARPVVVSTWNAERWSARNIALRLVALGYTNVHWYRGGKEVWEARGLPTVEARVGEL